MKVIAKQGNPDIATVYIAEMENGERVEFVESVDPQISIHKKWVSIVSTMFGCPVKCPICDAGKQFKGRLTVDEIFFQLNYLVENRFPTGVVDVDKWKIQFARMGEPSMNPAVLDVLEILPQSYNAPGMMPCISTIAPRGSDRFFERLLEIRQDQYPAHFQFQFSVHSTDKHARSKLIPIRTWGFEEMAAYGEAFHRKGSRKIALNFSLIEEVPIDPDVLLQHFDPGVFIIKITPLNPTFAARKNNMRSMYYNQNKWISVIDNLKSAGYEVIVSIGELEENAIGSNCGQFISMTEAEDIKLENSYTYGLQRI